MSIKFRENGKWGNPIDCTRANNWSRKISGKTEK